MSDTDNTDVENSEADVMDEWAAAMAESGDDASDLNPAKDHSIAGMNVKRAEMTTLQDTSRAGDSDVNLDVILDVPVTISMEIGSTKINIRNLLQLNQGSVIELDRLAGEPLDVKVNGTLIAHGEVVVVNEKFGIRLTDIISPQERVKRLK
ncbi:MAG: flagellar motor switch protein FliN [Gammaproteobacteria bacterium]|nr:flagellar motor switch protein FliN [Gammaproteobacteria bacterium]